jgi:hypothetical protein
MDTITTKIMEEAAHWLPTATKTMRYVHTVTIELNGATGKADMIVKGFPGNDVSLYNEQTVIVGLP